MSRVGSGPSSSSCMRDAAQEDRLAVEQDVAGRDGDRAEADPVAPAVVAGGRPSRRRASGVSGDQRRSSRRAAKLEARRPCASVVAGAASRARRSAARRSRRPPAGRRARRRPRSCRRAVSRTQASSTKVAGTDQPHRAGEPAIVPPVGDRRRDRASVRCGVDRRRQPVVARAQQPVTSNANGVKPPSCSPEPLAVEPDLGGDNWPRRSAGTALAGVRRGVEAALVPDQALIIAHLGRMGQPGRGQRGDRRVVEIVLVQRERVGCARLRRRRHRHSAGGPRPAPRRGSRPRRRGRDRSNKSTRRRAMRPRASPRRRGRARRA